MATPSVTYALAAGANADAGEVNTNFADLVAFLTNNVVHVDGTKVLTGLLSLKAGTDPTADDHAARKAYVDAQITGVLPSGILLPYAGTAVPTSWLAANGQTVNRVTYATLFGICSTTFNTGGEAGTDFRLPDLRGRVPVGLDNMLGASDAGRISVANTLGLSSGAETHTLTVTEMPSHSHTLGYQTGVQLAFNAESFLDLDGSTGTVASNTAGSSGAHNNMQPYTLLNWLIKT